MQHEKSFEKVDTNQVNVFVVFTASQFVIEILIFWQNIDLITPSQLPSHISAISTLCHY